MMLSLCTSTFNPSSTPTKKKFESADEQEDVYDTLEDEDEEEIGKAATVSWDEIHNLMRDEQEDYDHEWVQRNQVFV